MGYRPLLADRVTQIVGAPRWGGGVDRETLAWLLGVKPRDRAFVAALMWLYRQKRIDFCGQYVVPGLEAGQ